MKKIKFLLWNIYICILVLMGIVFWISTNISHVNASNNASNIVNSGDVGVVKPIICANEGECGLEQGIEALEGSLNDIETDRSISDFIQDIVVFVLSFVSLIAVVYIIYAWFMIMLGNGDEEKLKKSKQTIFYVIIGIVVMWLAYPITRFVIGALTSS